MEVEVVVPRTQARQVNKIVTSCKDFSNRPQFMKVLKCAEHVTCASEGKKAEKKARESVSLCTEERTNKAAFA